MSTKEDNENIDDIVKEVDVINKRIRVISFFIDNPDYDIMSIADELNAEGLDITAKEVEGILKSEFKDYGMMGKDLLLLGEKKAFRHMKTVIENQTLMYSKLYEAFEVARQKFYDGEIDALNLASLSKELRMREELILKTLNGFFEKKIDTAVQINNYSDVSTIIDAIKDMREENGSVKKDEEGSD